MRGLKKTTKQLKKKVHTSAERKQETCYCEVEGKCLFTVVRQTNVDTETVEQDKIRT